MICLAYGEIYTRLPSYYRQGATNEKHTSLHKNFSQSSLDLHNDQSYAPLTMHQSQDGTVFASILTRSNTEQLEKQGWYCTDYDSGFVVDLRCNILRCRFSFKIQLIFINLTTSNSFYKEFLD